MKATYIPIKYVITQTVIVDDKGLFLIHEGAMLSK